MQLVWYQREDGLWNAACACNAVVVGIPYERRAGAEEAHFEVARMERTFRASQNRDQIPQCGPKLPEPDPNHPGPRVFP